MHCCEVTGKTGKFMSGGKTRCIVLCPKGSFQKIAFHNWFMKSRLLFFPGLIQRKWHPTVPFGEGRVKMEHLAWFDCSMVE
jgi:hypothetical protein